MPTKDKRKLAAIMFADVVGYSRMMASNEERTLELLKDFENICSPIISDNEGMIIKKVGDELFCEFSSAKQAVDCALAIQEAIQPYNDSRPKDFKLQVRIGIHVGDIVLRDGDVFGDGVNVASRIQPFSSPGGICISSAVKEAVSSHPNYNIKSEGQQELKNILEKHTLFRVETGYEDEIISVKHSTISKKRIYIMTAVVLLLGIIGYTGFKYNYWVIIPVIEETFPDEIFFISNVRSNNEDLIILGDTLEVDGTTHLLSPISDGEIMMLNGEIITKTFPSLNNQFKYTTYMDIVNKMVEEGTLPVDFDYRWQEQQKLIKDRDDYNKGFIDSYVGSTNQFQIESDIHNAFYINVYEIEPPVDEINNYVMLLFLHRTIGDIIGENNESINYLDTLYTDLYDIGILQVADGGAPPFFSHSLDEIPYQLAYSVNSTIQEWININYISGYKQFQIGISAINNDKVVIKHNDDDNRLKINMILSVNREYQSDDNGKERFRTDLLNYLKAIKNNDILMTIFNEKTDVNGFTQTALDLILSENHCLSRPHCSFYYFLDTEIKIIEIFDNTAKGMIIKENDNPYIKIQVGDNLSFK
jgi:class 3 adenylate cyclase